MNCRLHSVRFGLLTLFVLSFISKPAHSQEMSTLFNFSKEQLASVATLQKQIADKLTTDFKPKKPARKPGANSCKKKKKREGRSKRAAMSAAASTLKFDCIQSCSFASAWAVASCQVTACAYCADGLGYCAEADAFGYGYAAAGGCMNMCLQKQIPAGCA